ncbi:MAG TPA: hypothetical protein VJ783_32010 [Pirellulales bacterium]|nr:hypothetical protein [Pirellulales bacterium]
MLNRTVWAIITLVSLGIFAFIGIQRHRAGHEIAMRQPEIIAAQSANSEPARPTPERPSSPATNSAMPKVSIESEPTETEPEETEPEVSLTEESDSQATESDRPRQQSVMIRPQQPIIRSPIEEPKVPLKPVDEVAKGLDSSNVFERRAAISALSGRNDVSDEATTYLEQHVRRETDDNLKFAAIDGILRLNENPQVAVDLLAEIVSGDTPANVQVVSKKYSPTLRRQALNKLGQIGPNASSAAPVVLKIMKAAAKGTAKFYKVFCECADCLAIIGSDRTDVTQALKSFANGRGFADKTPYVAQCKAAAERALATIERRAAGLPASTNPPTGTRRRTLADP